MSCLTPRRQSCRLRPPLDLLSWLFADIHKWSDRRIYIDADDTQQQLSADDVLKTTRGVISGLRVRGVGAGDSVCVLTYNSIWYTPIYLGIIGAGARFVGANPAYTTPELAHVLQVTNTKLVIADATLVDTALQAASSLNLPLLKVLSLHGVHPRCEAWQALLDHGQQDWVRFASFRESEQTVAAMMMTSGTTGMPKAAAISHRALILQAEVIVDAPLKTYHVKQLISIPQFHAFTIPLAHLIPLRYGVITYVTRRFKLDKVLDYIKAYEITDIPIVPPIVHSFVCTEPCVSAKIASLQHVYCAGAPLSRQSQANFVKLLRPYATFSQVWGMTEIGWISRVPFQEIDETGSVGRLLESFQAKIIGRDGSPVPDGGEGTIFVRSPTMMRGYLNNVAATQETVVDGWLNTGDVGYRKGGMIYLTDREKDLIKVRAWQVSPSEIEAQLLTHPAIVDAAVIGLPGDEASGERPRAYVRLAEHDHHHHQLGPAAPAAVITERDVQEFAARRLAKFKALTGGVAFTRSIPRNASGKILRKDLQKRALRELAAGSVRERRRPARLVTMRNAHKRREGRPIVDTGVQSR